MLTRVFRVLTDDARIRSAQLRMDLLRLISDTLDHTHIGQALDINARERRKLSHADYLAIVEEKTGYYLAAPILGGALVAGADEATSAPQKISAARYGPLFQVIDDLIDLTEGKGRGERGSDIREGKRSYLVAAVSEKATAQERERLFDILDLPREKTTAADVDEAIALFEKYGVLEDARAYANRLYDEAMQTLNDVPRALRELLDATFKSLAGRTT